MFDGEGVAKKMKGEVFMHGCYMPTLCQLHKWKRISTWEALWGGGSDSRHILIPKEVSLADRRFPYTHLGQPEMICLCE